jgi:hypothetical protein
MVKEEGGDQGGSELKGGHPGTEDPRPGRCLGTWALTALEQTHGQ